MAKRASSSSSKKKIAGSADDGSSASVRKTPVRKTVAPRLSAAKPAAVSTAAASPAPLTYDLICERAYYISISGTGGSETDNWFRAESELKNERGLV